MLIEKYFIFSSSSNLQVSISIHGLEIFEL